MSEGLKQNVDTSSADFKGGVKAELGQELKDEGDNREPMSEILFRESPTPLFIKDSQGNDGSAQDEKDETEE